MKRERRPASQAPALFRRMRFRRRSRDPWRTVSWVADEKYSVDGLAQIFDDPVDAIRAAESTHALARRVSDGRAINYYMALDIEEPKAKKE